MEKELLQAILDQLGLLSERIDNLVEGQEELVTSVEELTASLDRSIEWFPE